MELQNPGAQSRQLGPLHHRLHLEGAAFWQTQVVGVGPHYQLMAAGKQAALKHRPNPLAPGTENLL
jgi:hypothetical protein